MAPSTVGISPSMLLEPGLPPSGTVGNLDSGDEARRQTGRVLLRERDSARASALQASLGRAVGDCVLWTDELPRVEPTAIEDCVVVCGLDESRALLDQDVGLAVEQGFPVIAYGRRVDEWAVARRSRVLVLGAHDLLDSDAPRFADRLVTAVETLLASRARERRLRRTVAAVMADVGLIGESPEMLRVFSWVLRCRELSDLPVLVCGETGTGKELVARALHRLDPKRTSGRFVPVNCAALPVSLAEAELFGHRRGAFTGADRERPGLIRAADGGVLFLDEIGELDLAVQAKLLRVLEEGTVLSVGADLEREVDVRVVAATNRDLHEMAREGDFREDLLYRLDALSVVLPPLRDRRSDIPLLVEHFLRRSPARAGQAIDAGDDFVQALSQLGLPGNVRQLRNLVYEASLRTGGRTSVKMRDLPLSALDELAGERSAAPPPVAARSAFVELFEREGWSLSRCLDECERVLMEEALVRSNGNRTKAARMLGVSPRTVYAKMRKHRTGV